MLKVTSVVFKRHLRTATQTRNDVHSWPSYNVNGLECRNIVIKSMIFPIIGKETNPRFRHYSFTLGLAFFARHLFIHKCVELKRENR